MEALNPYGSVSDLMRLRSDLDSDITLRVVAGFLIAEENGDEYLVVTTIVEDPMYLNQTFITSTHYKKLPDATGWNPTPCSAK